MLDPVVAVIPAYNEAPVIAQVVRTALALQGERNKPLLARVIVVDNASDDGTGLLASQAGAQVVRESRRGYGAACLAGLSALNDAHTVVFIDGDGSTPIEQMPRLLQALHDGADLAVGARVSGRAAGMTLPQRLGNALACALIRLLWRAPVTDLGPFRAVRMDTLQRIAMQDRAYGWTVEMQVKALQSGLRVVEVPVDVRPRIGVSKISGTLHGVIGAAIGILGMITRLWWAQRRAQPVANRR